jgi:hypothetical protein
MNPILCNILNLWYFFLGRQTLSLLYMALKYRQYKISWTPVKCNVQIDVQLNPISVLPPPPSESSCNCHLPYRFSRKMQTCLQQVPNLYFGSNNNMSTSTLPSHLHLGFSDGLFPSAFPTTYSINANFRPHHTVLDRQVLQHTLSVISFRHFLFSRLHYVAKYFILKLKFPKNVWRQINSA